MDSRANGEAKVREVFSKVLARIKPSQKEIERDFSEAGRLVKKLGEVVPADVEIELAGSLAKGTHLRGKNEFDIFILFPRKYEHAKMVNLGLQYAKAAFKGMKIESRYAEHPYLQVFSGNYCADVVPAYKISEIGEKGSSVDRSQLHTRYVNSKLDAQGKDEVRLLKQFMKNFGIYGAELRVEGFSGYLCELLIIHYGSLLKLMEAACSWDKPVIDIEQHAAHGNPREAFSSPLIVIDPVDPKRNVAAVVAQTSLSRFIFECRRFLSAPSEKFFFSKKRVMGIGKIRAAMAARGTFCAAVCFPAPDVVPDVLWPQLKKTAQALVRHLSSLGFSVFGYYHWSDGKECVIFFELESGRLPAVRKAEGPAIRFASDVEAFVKKHRRAFNLHIEHDRIVAVEKRAFSDATSALRQACRKPSGMGIPANMARMMCKARLKFKEKVAYAKYSEFLSDYFFAKIA